jgi:Domain of unknown function (DUF4070)
MLSTQPVRMVGLLYALPNTQLTRRLEKEGRLHPHPERQPPGSADQCTMGLNFETLRPRREILADYKRVLERMRDGCSGWRKCSTIRTASSRPARGLLGENSAVSR